MFDIDVYFENLLDFYFDIFVKNKIKSELKKLKILQKINNSFLKVYYPYYSARHDIFVSLIMEEINQCKFNIKHNAPVQKKQQIFKSANTIKKSKQLYPKYFSQTQPVPVSQFGNTIYDKPNLKISEENIPNFGYRFDIDGKNYDFNLNL